MTGHSILVAESDPILAGQLTEMLTRAGHRVPRAVTATQDLRAAVARHQPELLIFDLDLPGAVEAVGIGVPVIALAASADHSPIAGRVVFKPVHEGELLAVIELTLQRQNFVTQLAAAKSELRTLIANVPGAVYRCQVDAPWLVSHVSEYIFSITGWPADEFLSSARTWTDTIVPAELARVAQLIAEAVAAHRPFHLEYPILHRDGTLRWVQESGRGVYDADGAPIHLDGVIVDITARKQTEAALEAERAELQAVYEEAPVMLCVLDGQRRFLYANRAFSEFAGKSSEQLSAGAESACGVLGCINALDDPRGCGFGVNCSVCDVRIALADTLLTGAVHRDIPLAMTRLTHGVPEHVSLLASTTPIPASGAPRLLLCLSDITSRELARLALARSEEMYRTLVENSGQAVVVAQDGALRFANATAERLLGRPRAQLTSTHFTEWIHPDDRGLVAERHAARTAGLDVPSSYPFRLLTADQGAVWVQLSVVPIEWGGQPATLNLLSDITAQVELESDYGNLFQSMLDGFAVHELVLDSAGQPADYRFLSVNPAFERLTGMSADRITGRTATEVMPNLEPHWLQVYSDVVRTGTPIRFQNRAAELDKWFEVFAFRPREGQFACVFQDITERKQMEDALLFLVECGYRNSGESFFQSLARYLAESLEMDYVCIDRLVGDGLSAQTIAVYSDGEFQDNTVYTLRDTPCGAVVGRSICCFPRDVRLLFPNDEALAQLGAESYAGATLWSFDGKPVGLIAVIGRKPLIDPKFVETVLKLVAVRAAGELEREQSDMALRESEERHRSILNACPDDITISDLEGRVKMVSPKAVALYGAGRTEDLVGRPLTSFLVPEDQPRAAADLTLLRGGGLEGFREYRAVRIDQSTFDVEVNGEIIRGPDGQPASLLFVIRDVSQRKKVEAALRASEDQYRILIHNLSAGVVVHGPDTRILLANPRASVLLGFDADRLPGRSAADPEWHFIHEDGTPVGFGSYPVNQVLATHQPLSHLVLGVVKPERPEPIWLLCDAYPVAAQDGAIQQVVVTFIDITERKRAEARLMHAQKMESVGRLAGGIAHDFNNLLTVINGYSLLMLDRLTPHDPMRFDLEAISKAGERAAALTSKILAFSRKQLLQPRVLDLNLLVDELRPLLVRMVGEDVEINVNLDHEPPLINADPHQLEQVVMNLVVNARDAMPTGGTISIETSSVGWSPGLEREHPDIRAGRYAVLTVSDDGLGMDEETGQHIFEPFFTTKGLGQGTGLGLSMVQGIVAQSGGFVEVSSELGQGATFRIYLPRVDESQSPSRPHAAPRARGGHESILVVEDEPGVLQLAAQTLERYGYRVAQAESGVDALAQFLRAPASFDLVLTDVVMPGLSGRELADKLRVSRPGLKVLFMSGYPGDAVVRHGVAETGSEFIQKPFSPDGLAARVRAILESN